MDSLDWKPSCAVRETRLPRVLRGDSRVGTIGESQGPMTISIDDFVQSLSDCGLVAIEELKQLQASAPFEDVHQFARDLIEKKRLTRFQAFVALRGDPASLILGDYVILDEIGHGGMGTVYRARHTRMFRDVAIKTLRSPKTKKRFEREIRTAGMLVHPNIVTAYDAREDAGRVFLVMEYVDGSDLATVVDRDGPLEPELAVKCIVQAAEGLQFAHDKGIVHRDVKPSNMILSDKGQLKILDVGLARF